MAEIEPHPDLALDHIFICTPDRPRALEALTAAGLNPGPNRVHDGQGTANDCFYFENAYLELLWLNDEAEIRSPLVQPLGLWERVQWLETGACPSGVAVRPSPGFNVASLESWPYRAPFLPVGAAIPILTPPGSTKEPMVFLSLVSVPPSEYPSGRQAPLVHRGTSRRITAVEIEVPESAACPRGAARDSLSGVARVASRGWHHMAIELNGGHGDVSDLRPVLPLEIRW